MPADEASERHEHHDRLLEGMTRAVAAKGYAETTIADIVREAAVSRRSFYEHFATKADCLVALYRTASEQALAVLANAVDPLQPWETQVEHAVAAYLGFLAADPALLRMLFVEILGLGLTGLAVRRETNLRIASFIRAAAMRDETPLMSERLAMTVVGGINELILQAVEQGLPQDLRELVAPSTQLIFAVARDGVRRIAAEG
ncbi:MAG: TetR/AcrR family transcriptional regulator [Variovorax sp.]|nr:MAG: TetR/AcrR family transcriptional regulator [Variovorax sp.]